MISRSIRFVAGIIPAFLVLAGCAAEPETTDATAPDVADTAVEVQQSVGWGSFTMSAARPTGSGSNVQGSFTVTGSGTALMGACLLNQVWVGDIWSTSNVNCSSASECTGYIPSGSGGSAYCAAAQNSGQKTCWVRPGSQAGYCAGSPANGGSAIGAGTYYTPAVAAWGAYQSSACGLDMTYNFVCTNWAVWMTYGCFNGCTGNGGAPTTASQSSLLGAYWQSPYSGFANL